MNTKNMLASLYLPGLIFGLLAIQPAQAISLVSVSQQGNSIQWSVAPTSFPVSQVLLSITGPDQAVPLPNQLSDNCEASPFVCIFSFAGGTNPQFSTSDLIDGAYNWEISLVPDSSQVEVVCDTQSNVRELQGGGQGLSGGAILSPEEIYKECLSLNNILPPDPSQLRESGNFVLTTASGGLIVPNPNTDPNAPDNLPPMALCRDVTVNADANTCTAIAADINNGSFDPDGTLSSLVQAPAGPFDLGSTVATLTATDDKGAVNSCSATVTVIDITPPIVTASLVPVARPDDDDDDDKHHDKFHEKQDKRHDKFHEKQDKHHDKFHEKQAKRHDKFHEKQDKHHDKNKDKNKGFFQIEFSCDDSCGPDVITSAKLNGTPVANGQFVKLEIDDDIEVEMDDGVLEFEAPSFELVASCTDASGNVGTATASPVLSAKNDDDDDDDDGDDD